MLSRVFNQRALDVLDECYETDSARIQQLIRRPLPEIHNQSCLELAAKAQNRKFLSHKCCNNVVNEIWNGFVSQETPYYKVIHIQADVC